MIRKTKEKTTIIICAHSDDQIFGPGATLAKLAKEGERIITIIMSYGELSHPHFKPEKIKEIRKKESIEADKIIGGKGVIFIGAKDGAIKEAINNKKIMNKITRIIKKEKPERILTHTEDDPHPDHRATCEIVKKIHEKEKLTIPVYGFDVWNLISLKKRTTTKWVVDVSDTFKTKIKALKCFKSQINPYTFINYIAYAAMITRAFFNGLKYNYKFAEVFYKIK